MTLEQAKQAMNNDPHYQSEKAKYFLREHSNAHNTNYMRLYREGMNRKEAEAALYNDNEYEACKKQKKQENFTRLAQVRATQTPKSQ
jgi:hypothetical protein